MGPVGDFLDIIIDVFPPSKTIGDVFHHSRKVAPRILSVRVRRSFNPKSKQLGPERG